MRLAANYAIDRQALSDAETLGASKPAGNHVPRTFEFALPHRAVPVRSRRRPKQLLAEAGYPNGFDAGELHQLPPYFSLGEAIVGYFQAVGIRTRMRPMERAAYFALIQSKKAKGVCVCTSSLYGNAASRLSEVIPSDGAYAYGGYPDIDALFKQQALETDKKKREAMLHQIQRLVYERVRYGPIYRVHLAERDRAARGRARADADQSVPVVGAPRRRCASRSRERRYWSHAACAPRGHPLRAALREGLAARGGRHRRRRPVRGQVPRGGAGAKALIAELIVGQLAQALGLPVPELAIIELSAAFGRSEPDPEIRTSCGERRRQRRTALSATGPSISTSPRRA